MDICPECKSDDVEKTYSIGLRVIVCVILLFIPYGIFFCWIPFVFPYRHICNVCGTEVNSDQLLRMDWREREELSKEHQKLEEKITPYLGKWIEDQTGKVFKVAKGKGQIFLVEINDVKNVTTYRVTSCKIAPPKIEASSKVGRKFRNVIQDSVSFDANENSNETTLTEIGKDLLTETEFNLIKDDDIDIHNWLKELDKQKVDIEILSGKREQS